MKNLLLCFLLSASLIACTGNTEKKKEENVTITSDDIKPDLVSIKAEIQAGVKHGTELEKFKVLSSSGVTK